MKKLLLTVASFLSCCTIAVKADPAASITLSDPVVENNISLYVATHSDAITNKTTKGGLACIEIPTGNYAYFRVDDATIPQSENNLIFRITYFDEGTNEIQFQYNATLAIFYKTINIKKTGTNTWITATIAVTDASLINMQNNQADFRIGATNYISSVSIEKGVMNPANEPKVPVNASSYSEFLGKSVTGYQAWFSTGDATSGWFHWNGTTPPSAGKLSFEVYPDVTEYADADLTQTALADLGNGAPSRLFNSANDDVIELHFNWLKKYGIDGVALQRFINGLGYFNDSQEAVPVKVKKAAEATDRIFYICYDISSAGLDATWATIIKNDWVYNIEQNYELIQSDAYAKVGNKPVVQIWGTGFIGNHPGTAAETIDLINFLKDRGCYVIGGVPTHWRNQNGDSKPGFISAYNEYDMLSPWLVGRFDNTEEGEYVNTIKTIMQDDKTYCDNNNINYMPVLFPGFAWSQWNTGSPNAAPRNAGQFMWSQAVDIKNLGVQNMYFAMFDEYDEGTALMKAATDWSMIPTNQYFLTTSADGYWLSSDFQLRVAGAAIEMLKGTRDVTATVPVAHSEGPVYYRNSFEKRTTPYNYVGGVAQSNGTFNLDPCFKNPSQLSANAVSGQSTAIEETTLAKSGLYAAKISGNTSGQGSYYYKFADAKITIKTNMELSFSKYTVNELGKYTSVSLAFDDGTYLHNLTLTDTDGTAVNPKNARGTQGAWTEHTIVIGKDNLIGKTITGILLGYEGDGNGSFEAYFDNLLIQDGDPDTGINIPATTGENTGYIYAVNGTLFVVGYPANSTLTIYNVPGQEVANYPAYSSQVNTNLPAGMYIVKINNNGKTETHKVLIEK